MMQREFFESSVRRHQVVHFRHLLYRPRPGVIHVGWVEHGCATNSTISFSFPLCFLRYHLFNSTKGNLGKVMDSTPTILLVAGSANRHAEVRAALERSGLSVTPRFFHSWPTADLSNYRLAIVDSTDAMDDATAFARNWLRTKERPTRPLIWLADTLDPKAR